MEDYYYLEDQGTPYFRRALREIPELKTTFWIASEIREAVMGPNMDLVAMDMKKIAEMGRIKIVFVNFEDATGGLLRPMPNDEFTVKLDPSIRNNEGALSTDHELTRETARFFLGHEIGHSLFFQRKPPHVPRRFRLAPIGDPAEFENEEYFCDTLSAALLLPTSVLRQETYTVSEILALRKQYIVPVTVIQWALIHYSRDFWKNHIFADAYYTSVMNAMSELQT